MAQIHQISIDGHNCTVEYSDGWNATYECKIVTEDGFEATGFGDTQAEAARDACEAIRFMINKFNKGE